MQVEYNIKSYTHGEYGIYSKTKIKKGSIIWNLEKSKGIIIPSNAINVYKNSISKEELDNCIKNSYIDHNEDLIDLTLDDRRYFKKCNETYNIKTNVSNFNLIYASKDIKIGEELVINLKMN